MSWTEGLGLALFFPLLHGEGGQDPLSSAFNSILGVLHVKPPNFMALEYHNR